MTVASMKETVSKLVQVPNQEPNLDRVAIRTEVMMQNLGKNHSKQLIVFSTRTKKRKNLRRRIHANKKWQIKEFPLQNTASLDSH